MSHFYKDDLGRVMFHADQPGGGSVISVANEDYRMRHAAEWQAFRAAEARPVEEQGEDAPADAEVDGAAKDDQSQNGTADDAAQPVSTAQDSTTDQS